MVASSRLTRSVVRSCLTSIGLRFSVFEGLRDYPRTRWARDKAHVPAKYPIEVTFELTEDDVTSLEAQLGQGVVQGRTVIRRRTYGDKTSTILEMQVDENAAMRERLGKVGLDPKLADGCKTFAELTVKLQALEPNEAPAAATLASELAESAGGVAPPAAHRTGHKPLDLSGSCHPTYGRTPNRQCTNRLGSCR
jgi:hypothetical protein